MKAKRNIILLLAVSFMALQCVQFQETERRTPLPEAAFQECRLPAMEPEFINFHMANWPEARELMEQELENSPALTMASADGQSNSPLRLRISIEGFPTGKHLADFMEEDPFAFTWRRLSQIAFRWSFGIVPIYEPRERVFLFEIWDGNQRIRQYRYFHRYHVLVGLPALLVAPFVDSRSIEEEAREVMASFKEDACFHPVYALNEN